MQPQLGGNEAVLGIFRGFRETGKGRGKGADFYVTDEYVHFEGLRIPYNCIKRKKVSEVGPPSPKSKNRERYVVSHEKFGSIVNTMSSIHDESLPEEEKVNLEFEIAEMLVEKEGEVMIDRENEKRKTLEPRFSNRRDSTFEFFQLKDISPVICLLREDILDNTKVNVVLRERQEYTDIKDLFAVQESNEVYNDTVKDFRVNYEVKEKDRVEAINGIKKAHEKRVKTLDVQFKDQLKDVKEKMKQRDFIHKKELFKLTDKYGKTMKILQQSSRKMRNDYENLVKRIQSAYETREKHFKEQSISQIRSIVERHQTLMKEMNEKHSEQVQMMNEIHEEYTEALKEDRKKYEEVVMNEVRKTSETLDKEYSESLEAVESQNEETISIMRKGNEETIEMVKSQTDEKIQKIEKENTETIDTLTKEYNETLDLMKQKHGTLVTTMEEEHNQTVVSLKEGYENTIEELEKDHKSNMDATVGCYEECVEDITKKHKRIFETQKKEAEDTKKMMEEEHFRTMESTKEQLIHTFETTNKESKATLEIVKAEHQETVNVLKSQMENAIQSMEKENQESIDTLEVEYQRTLSKQAEEDDMYVEELNEQHSQETEFRTQQFEKTMKVARKEHRTSLDYVCDRYERSIDEAGKRYLTMERKYLDQLERMKRENEHLRDSIFTRERQVERQAQKIVEVEARVEELSTRNLDLEDQREQMSEDFATVKNHADRLQSMFVECTHEITRLREECKRLDELRRQAEAALLPYVERVKFLEQRLEDREAEILVLTRHLQENIQLREKMLRENKYLKSRFKLLKKTIMELSAKLNVSKERNDKYEKILTQLKIEKSSLPSSQQRKSRARKTSTNKLIESLSAPQTSPLEFTDDHFHLKRLERQFTILDKKHHDLQEKHEVLVQKNRDLERNQAKMKKMDRSKSSYISELKTEVIELEKHLERKHSKNKTLNSKLLKLAKEHQNKETNLQFLEAKMIELMNQSFEQAVKGGPSKYEEGMDKGEEKGLIIEEGGEEESPPMKEEDEGEKKLKRGPSVDDEGFFKSPQFQTTSEQLDRFRHVPLQMKSKDDVLKMTTPTPVSQKRLNEMIYGDDPVLSLTPMTSVGFKHRFGSGRKKKKSKGIKTKEFRVSKGVQTIVSGDGIASSTSPRGRRSVESSPRGYRGTTTPRKKIVTPTKRRRTGGGSGRGKKRLSATKRRVHTSPRMSPSSRRLLSRNKKREPKVSPRVRKSLADEYNEAVYENDVGMEDEEADHDGEDSEDEEEKEEVLDGNPLSYLVASPNQKNLGDLLL